MAESLVVKPYEQLRVSSFLRTTYLWMSIGLILTGAVAWFTAHSPTILSLVFSSQLTFILLIIAELGLVFYLSARISKMSPATAMTSFIIYSALSGLTLSVIFLVFTQESIVSVFFISAGMFLALSIYGFVTKRDLTGWGSFLFMGLIGIIIAMLVNFFLKSSMLAAIISYVGVLVFAGLTAYDTQKLKNMALHMPSDVDVGTVRKGAIMGALTLYLDFINLFLMLLRIFGDRR